MASKNRIGNSPYISKHQKSADQKLCQLQQSTILQLDNLIALPIIIYFIYESFQNVCACVSTCKQMTIIESLSVKP